MAKLTTIATDALATAQSLGIMIYLDHWYLLDMPVKEIERQRRHSLGIAIGEKLDAAHIIQSCTRPGRFDGDSLYDPRCARDTWRTEITFMPTSEFLRLKSAVRELEAQLKELNR